MFPRTKNTFRESSISGLVCLLSALMGCGGGATSSPSGMNSSPILTSITVTPPSPTISVGASEQFTAIGTYADGSTQNVTKAASWSSSAPAVAVIQNANQSTPGMAAATAAGTATITASLSSISGVTQLIVSDISPKYISLTDMSPTENYLGFAGGLYENLSNTVPSVHSAVGQALAVKLAPIQGKIVVLSITMSNGGLEWGRFITNYGTNPLINPAVALVNGENIQNPLCDYQVAFGNPQSVCGSSDTTNAYDYIYSNSLQPAGFSESQVEAVWLKHTDTIPTASGFPVPPSLPGLDSNSYTYEFEQHLAGALRGMYQRYPHLKFVFISTRIYGGYCPSPCKSPEPYAYENGFAVKWLIQSQINQADRGAGPDPVFGTVTYSNSPWIAWGPYIWADGSIPRSDGLTWCAGSLSPSPPCNGEQDYQSDLLHPNDAGQTKVANMLWDFFSTSVYTTPWFLAPRP
jgi:hypothetical protein